MTAVAFIAEVSQSAAPERASSAMRPLPAILSNGLSPHDVLRVNAARPSFRTLRPSESLYFQGDESHYIYLLLDGWAFRHQSLEDGRRQILDFALPGAVFGFPAASTLTHGVEVLTPCTFSVFTRDNLFDLLQRVPVLGLRFIDIMAGAEARAYEHLTSVGRRTARERVANLLMELLLRARRMESAGSTAKMTLPLMQPHIADALGLASETVCRTLAAMRRDGVLLLRAQKLEVQDIDRLSEEAGIDRADATPRQPPVAARMAQQIQNHLRQDCAAGAYH
jgi:CRP/FNR family transcriptional regulator, anaerobic regulatory protein